jgi:hypothetical protein
MEYCFGAGDFCAIGAVRTRGAFSLLQGSSSLTLISWQRIFKFRDAFPQGIAVFYF